MTIRVSLQHRFTELAAQHVLLTRRLEDLGIHHPHLCQPTRQKKHRTFLPSPHTSLL